MGEVKTAVGLNNVPYSFVYDPDLIRIISCFSDKDKKFRSIKNLAKELEMNEEDIYNKMIKMPHLFMGSTNKKDFFTLNMLPFALDAETLLKKLTSQ